jgi:hypothetical protein
VLTAPLGGEFETLDGDCDLFGTPDRPRSIDVSGPVVAYGRCTADGRQELVVRDFSTPAPVEHVVPGAFPIGVRIAGRYLAWLEEGTGQPYTASGITVYDWLLGTVAYRLPKASMPGDVHDLDLQDDGKVAFSFAGKNGQVAWASQSEPSAHVLDLPARANYEVRIAGDRIGYEAGRHAGAGELTLADIGVSDLAGHTHRVGTLGEGSVFTDDFDFDGTHLAWWSYGCTRAFVHIADANGAAQISPRRSGCRLRFAGKPTISGNIVRLRVDCFGFPLGSCRARDVTLTVRRAQRVLVVGRGRTAGHVVLTPLGHRLLRLRRPLRVRARATLSDDAGRSERRSGRLTLR